MKKQEDIFSHLKVKRLESPDATYFNNLANEIIQLKKSRVVPLYKKPILWIGSAAAVITAIVVFNFSQKSIDSSNSLLALNNIPTSEVLEYVDDNIDEFDTELLVEFISNVDVKNYELYDEVQEPNVNSETLSESTISMDDINEQDILDYFNEQGIDLYDIEDESFI